jgi:hypothetical protein
VQAPADFVLARIDDEPVAERDSQNRFGARLKVGRIERCDAASMRQ